VLGIRLFKLWVSMNNLGIKIHQKSSRSLSWSLLIKEEYLFNLKMYPNYCETPKICNFL